MSRFLGRKSFAFSIFSDTDNSIVDNIQPVYRLLGDLGDACRANGGNGSSNRPKVRKVESMVVSDLAERVRNSGKRRRVGRGGRLGGKSSNLGKKLNFANYGVNSELDYR